MSLATTYIVEGPINQTVFQAAGTWANTIGSRLDINSAINQPNSTSFDTGSSGTSDQQRLTGALKDPCRLEPPPPPSPPGPAQWQPAKVHKFHGEHLQKLEAAKKVGSAALHYLGHSPSSQIHQREARKDGQGISNCTVC